MLMTIYIAPAPSESVADQLVAFWENRDSQDQFDRGLTDPQCRTDFLADLYQDLSESARKTYALVSTPTFVEEYILSFDGQAGT